MAEKATIEQVDRELVVPAPPGDVWTAVIGDGWLAEEVELELTPGGEARFADRESVRTGWVEEAHPPREDRDGLLVFWWGANDEPASRVELTLRPEGPGHTRVRVIESRPLEVLDLIGLPLPGQTGTMSGPAMLALA